jgi:hypothetical protein
MIEEQKMKLNRNRLIAAIGLCASFGFLPTAFVAEGVPADKFPQANANLQQPGIAAPAPAAQVAGAGERVAGAAARDRLKVPELNVPGTPAFGRVAST